MLLQLLFCSVLNFVFQIHSGVTPPELCCISTLNSIMAQSIESSVYACQSENAETLSFAFKSIPQTFRRNGMTLTVFIIHKTFCSKIFVNILYDSFSDVEILDFLELGYKVVHTKYMVLLGSILFIFH